MPNINWSSQIIHEMAVVTGCDQANEWMLKWWHENYKISNDYPVYFANFGMSSDAKKWCSEYGKLIDLTFKIRKNWFKKPFAILGVPAKLIIWIDLDCEIRKSIEPIFKYANDGIAITLDKYHKRNEAVASGVVGVSSGNPLILKWAAECCTTSLRGDQEVLNNIISQHRDKIVIMPQEFQWLRLDGDNKDAVIMHWTGGAGKNHIRKMIGIAPVIHKSRAQRFTKTQIIHPHKSIIQHTKLTKPMSQIKTKPKITLLKPIKVNRIRTISVNRKPSH